MTAGSTACHSTHVYGNETIPLDCVFSTVQQAWQSGLFKSGLEFILGLALTDVIPADTKAAL